MGLWSKLKGTFGGENDNESSKSTWKEATERGERELREAEKEQEERWREQDELLERIERRKREEASSESASEDFKEKAEERDRFQEEWEETMREAREEQERQEKREEEKAKPEAEETDAGAGQGTETERERLVRLRKEYIEDLQLRGAKAKAESLYTRTGQLKSTFKETAKGVIGLGGAKGVRATTAKDRYKDKDKSQTHRAIRAVQGVATLGGAVHISKARKHLYTPKVNIDYYVPRKSQATRGTASMFLPTGMKQLTTPSTGPGTGRELHTSTLRRAGTPSYEKLRQTTAFRSRQSQPQPRTTFTTPAQSTSPIARMATGTPRHLAKPMGFVKIGSQAQDVAMERLRGLTFPTGLTNTEKLAYAEIKANHDIDTKSHVVSELMDLGIDKLEASRAIEGLLHRKIAKRGKPFDGEPTLEIT